MNVRKVLISLFVFLSILDEILSTEMRSRKRKKTPTKKKPTKAADCICGRRPSSNTRIVGGKLTTGYYPWMGALVYTGKGEATQFCGSTLINNQYMLTASHCVYEIRNLENYQIYLGSNQINGSDVKKYPISKILRHARFNPSTLDFDIALIKLQKPVTISNRVKPICLAKGGMTFEGKMSNVAGWGTQRKGGNPTNDLREAWVRVIDNTDCAKNYTQAGVTLTQNMLCAGAKGRVTRDSCSGDSGGPLIIQDGNVFRQIGIVSFGIDCGSPTYPGVYTRVSRFIKWIRENTKDARYCSKSFAS